MTSFGVLCCTWKLSRCPLECTCVYMYMTAHPPPLLGGGILLQEVGGQWSLSLLLQFCTGHYHEGLSDLASTQTQSKSHPISLCLYHALHAIGMFMWLHASVVIRSFYSPLPLTSHLPPSARSNPSSYIQCTSIPQMFPELKFRYVEEAQPEEFFVPYVWTLVLQTSPLHWQQFHTTTSTTTTPH